MCTILKTSCAVWSTLLLVMTLGVNLSGATESSSTNSTTKSTAWQVVGPSTQVRPAIVTTAFRAPVVMVNAWDEKFAIEYQGKVHQFKMAHGGLLFRKGKPTT